MLALALATAFGANPDRALAQTNPSGGVAIHGQMRTSTPAPNQLQVVTQNGAGSNHSSINWQSFSISAGSSTTFVQPSASSLSINRVVTNTPSAIFGSLSSNGRLVLVNQSGIAVGAGAVIDTAGFTASALRMSDADALAGRLRFGDLNASMGGAGGISVGGRITARDGDVVLIAPNIDIGGSALLQAPNGSTLLAAGQQVEITGRGLEGITLLVQAPGDQVRNLGRLEGNAVGIFAGTLRHSGEIQATTASLEGGTVVLKAAGDALVLEDAKITATGTKGGKVDVLGNRVALADQASIDVSGARGGGSIRIGGDYQGKNPDLPNAQMVYVGVDTRLKADATESGDGGRVIVWADGATRAHGTIAANAAGGGGGGFVETSGRDHLEVGGIRVTASGADTRPGTWLLDPADITITSGAATSPYPSGNKDRLTQSFGPGSITTFFPVASASASTMTDGDINAFLNGASNLQVVVQTANSPSGSGSGDITFDGLSGGSIVIGRTNNANSNTNTLSFNADRNIVFGPGSTTFRRSGASTGFALTVELNPGITSAGKIFTNAGASVVLDGINDELGVNVKNGKVWENSGTVTMNGVSVIRLPNQSGYASFKNMAGGILGINSSSNWSFLSDGSVQGGIVTNAGSVNVNGTAGGNSTSWEALYSNLSGGTLNVGAGKFLSMQNGGTLGGSVFIGTGGELRLSEQHAGPIAFTNTSFSGAGKISVAPGVSANINAPAGTIGQLDVGGTVAAQSGTLAVSSYSQTTGGSSFGGSGGLQITNAFSHTAGTFAPTGSVSITQATGNLNFTDPLSVTSLALTASSGLLTSAAAVTSSGDVTLTADSINVTAAINAPSGQVKLRPATLARNTIIESGSTAGVLSLQPADLQFVSANVLEVGRLDGTGNLNLNTNLTSANINAATLRLLAGNNFNSIAGANIGSAGTPFNHSLELIAANDVQLTNGNIFVADNKSLSIFADNDNSGAGAVNIGAVILQVGSTGASTGNMFVDGQDINAIVSGGGSADIRVTGSGNQSISAANNITFANSNPTSGSLRVGTGSGLQTITAGGNLQISAGTGTTTYTQVYSNGNQSFNVGGMLLDAGASGSGNDVTVVSFLGSQNFVLGSGGLHLTAGGGTADNFAALYQFGTTGTNQTITVNGGGSVTLQGGSSTATNVGAGSGSFATIHSDGSATQQIGFLSGGTLQLTGGSNGSKNFASIKATNGAQTVSGASAITLTGGTNGGFAGEGNRAVIAADAGAQMITGSSIALQGGAAGTENRAGIAASLGSQTLNIGSGGLSLTGGGGSVTDRKNYASVFQGGPAGKTQTITVSGGGDITVQGGSSAGTNVGTDNGSFAFITSDGDSQTVQFSAPGSVISVTGGSVGSFNFAGFSARNGNQTLRGTAPANNPSISLTGGASGGVAAEDNGAYLVATGTQTIMAGATALQGGNGGIGNGAFIAAPIQALTFNGNVNLTGSNGGDANSGARIGGRATSNTNLTLGITGNLTLNGGSTSGVAVGASSLAVGADQVVLLNASGDVVLNPSATQGVRLGAAAAAPQTGGILVTAGGNIALNSAGGTGVSGVRSLGDVSLTGNALAISGGVSGARVNLHGTAGVSLPGPALINATATSGTTLTVEVDSGAFTNSAGAGVFSIAPGGRWLVYSVNPANDTRGGLAFDFKQYGALPASPVLGTGNGFLYSVTPTLNAALVGVVKKVYDGDAIATLTPANFSGTGLLAGDVATLGSPGSAVYDTRHVGTGKTVTVTGATLSGVTDNGKPVFGYASTLGTLSAPIGTITVLPTATWTGSAGDGLWSSAGNWSGGALPDGANVAAVVIPAGAGSVVMDSLATGVNLQSLSSARPVTQSGGSLFSPQLTLKTDAGISLSNPANQISALRAENFGGDNIVIVNGVPLNLLAMLNTGGNINITNTGAVSTSSPILAPGGHVFITANGPLSIGAGGVDASGNIVLTANNLTSVGNLISAGNLTLDGPVRAGNTVRLDAENNLVQNNIVFGLRGVSARAGGAFSYGPMAITNNSPISYSAGGATVSPPPAEGLESVGRFGQIDLFVAFLDRFERALEARLDRASFRNPDGSRSKKKYAGDLVAEGDVCR